MRASTSIAPGCAPPFSPASLTAARRGPCAVSAINASGCASTPSPAASPSTSRQRSSASCLSQMARIRRGGAALPAGFDRLGMMGRKAGWSDGRDAPCPFGHQPAIVTQHPGSRGMAAGTEQFCLPARHAGSLRIPARLRRGAGLRAPAHAGGRQVGLRVETNQPERHAVTLGSKAETARGGEVERAGIAGHFADDESEVAAAQPFFQCEECIFCTTGGDMDEAMTQGARQAGKIGPAAAPERLAVLHPKPHAILLRIGRRPIGRPGSHAIERKGKGKAGPGAFVSRGENFTVGDFPGNQVGAPCIGLPDSEAGGSGNGTDFNHRIAPEK
ncbi:exported hypothetical protein [Novosphingobium sp. KN65.2]|nr:exported hypothetical protein [Novosphingobium sp. KN65.2]